MRPSLVFVIAAADSDRQTQASQTAEVQPFQLARTRQASESDDELVLPGDDGGVGQGSLAGSGDEDYALNLGHDSGGQAKGAQVRDEAAQHGFSQLGEKYSSRHILDEERNGPDEEIPGSARVPG